MTRTQTEYKYVELDEGNVPMVAGTTLKVVEIIIAQRAYGWSPEEYYLNHRYLTMSQIHGALTYYWDHKQELDADIERREEYVKQAEKAAGESPFVARLKAQGLLK